MKEEFDELDKLNCKLKDKFDELNKLKVKLYELDELN